MRVVISDNILDSCVALTDGMLRILKQIPEREIYLAISGGSTPAALFDLWVRRYEHEVDWKRIQLFWVDERCVPPADKESNYRMSVTHLISKLPFLEKHIHRIHGEASPAEEVERYSQIVRKLLPWENGIPVFDLILLGIGSDGHTASLFPGDSSLDDRVRDEALGKTLLSNEDCYKVAIKPENGQQRISMTIDLINNAKNIFFLATGRSKSKVISSICYHLSDAQQYPAARVNPVRGEVIWFLDGDAAWDACNYAK